MRVRYRGKPSELGKTRQIKLTDFVVLKIGNVSTDMSHTKFYYDRRFDLEHLA